MIKTQKLNKFYNNKHILKDINCKIEKNEKVLVIGTSGSGKSTFLRCFNLKKTPTSKNIFFKNSKIADKKPSKTRYINDYKKFKNM